LQTHNWWHLALFQLELNRPDAALDLYDRRVWGVRKASCQDQANAVSLLARLEILGVDVGDRWGDLAGFLKPRTAEHVNGLLDLHYAYGLARAGADTEADSLLESLGTHAGASSEPVWRDVMPVAAAGVVAHARRQRARAAAWLGRALPRLHLVGGSSTQRNLFHLLHRDALASA
ncbi:MAG: tetratricopeptide repeat protein, partial [Sandaracinobacteroides sp.]